MQTDKLIAQARNKDDPTRFADVPKAPIEPSVDEIDRFVRNWVKTEHDKTERATPRSEKPEQAKAMGRLATITHAHLTQNRDNSLLTAQWMAEAFADQQGWTLGPRLRDYFFERMAMAQHEVAVRLRADFGREGAAAPTHRMFDPAAFTADEAQRNAPAPKVVPIMEVFQRYAAEQQPEPKTIKKWKAALNSLITYLGHDDASRVQPDDVIKWKDFLLAPGVDGTKARGQGTVRNGYLGAIKPVFEWARSNKLIGSNPAAGITVSVPKRQRHRTEKGFTAQEAQAVLTAATEIDWGDGTFTSFAFRWVPWLCAYTGARVGEIAQLRDIDIGQNANGIWYATITPEAGSQKGGFTRQVALHPHLIEQGFIDAVKGRKGPLFYDPKRRRQGSSGNPQYVKVGERVARWVRSIGITDTELQPNHGWRHRFTTVARRIGMDRDVREAFMGHVAQTEHGEYGDVLVETSFEWMTRFPRYSVNVGDSE